MNTILVVCLALAVSCGAVRLPVPYEVYVRNGGLPVPEALRTGKWYNPYNGTDSYVVGGTNAKAGEVPHIASLATSSHFCGSSILDATTLITAAHCVDGSSASSIKARVGSLKHASGGQQVQVQTIRSNAQYNPSTIDYDIAILKLASALTLDNNNVKAITLPSSEPASGSSTLVAGWGTTRAGAGTLPADLQRANVNIVARATCNSNYGSGITDRMICAAVTGGGVDACQGDSGGPLTQNGVLVGVVSWGRSCALAAYPGVYTNVASLLTWISQNRN